MILVTEALVFVEVYHTEISNLMTLPRNIIQNGFMTSLYSIIARTPLLNLQHRPMFSTA